MKYTVTKKEDGSFVLLENAPPEPLKEDYVRDGDNPKQRSIGQKTYRLAAKDYAIVLQHREEIPTAPNSKNYWEKLNGKEFLYSSIVTTTDHPTDKVAMRIETEEDSFAILHVWANKIDKEEFVKLAKKSFKIRLK